MSRTKRAGKPRLPVPIPPYSLTHLQLLTRTSPRDGKNLTLAQVEQSLITHLHMSKLLATSLTSALKPLVRKDGTFDLSDTRKHNVIGGVGENRETFLH